MPATVQRLRPLPPAPQKEIRTLIDELLDEQRALDTPVARFSRHHDETPDLEERYRSLIPLTKPGPDEQFAFEVALDRCTGCKACVSACHSLNGLDEHEMWRDTGTIVDARPGSAWQQTVTSACHHCEDPGCLNGCPVAAYVKEPDTGIVRHLDDQCIGCSYCILKCPFDVPKYSPKRGIVRKCDMCHQRLASGEAPACVQACPTEAIRIVTVAKQRPPELLTGSPDPTLTRPTTRYTGRDVPASAFAADRDVLVPQHAHWPLVLMLTLTQAGIGLLIPSTRPAAVAALIFFAGMAASVLHLGQPLKAWRFFLGLCTSWLSREILVFSAFAPVPLVLAAWSFLPEFPFHDLVGKATTATVAPLGLLAVFTSVMIYHDTGRDSWRLPVTAFRFFGTVAVFAALAAEHFPAFAAVVMLRLLPEVRLLFNRPGPWSPSRHVARLTRGPLRRFHDARIGLALASVAALPVSPWLALPLLLGSEVLERLLFFRAVHAPKMPGHPGPPAPHA